MRRAGKAVLVSICLSLSMMLLSACSLASQEASSAASASEMGLVLADSSLGPYVLAVLCDSPACAAGFHPGDIVLQADDSPLADAASLDAALTEGRCRRFTLMRDGKEIHLER